MESKISISIPLDIEGTRLLYFNPLVQSAIHNSIKRIMGKDNKDDAIQEAYVAISDENPLTVDDACLCVIRAIERYRNRLRKISTHEQRDNDSWIDNSESYYKDTPDELKSQTWWDTKARKESPFSKTDIEFINKMEGRIHA